MKNRRNIILLCSSLLGICAASAIFLLLNRHPASVSDKQATTMGYASAARKDAIYSLLPGEPKFRDLSDTQILLIRDVLKNDSDNAKNTALTALNYVKSKKQKQMAIQIIEPYIANKNTQTIAYSLLERFACEDANLVKGLQNNPDPVVVKAVSDALQACSEYRQEYNRKKK